MQKISNIEKKIKMADTSDYKSPAKLSDGESTDENKDQLLEYVVSTGSKSTKESSYKSRDNSECDCDSQSKSSSKSGSRTGRSKSKSSKSSGSSSKSSGSSSKSSDDSCSKSGGGYNGGNIAVGEGYSAHLIGLLILTILVFLVLYLVCGSWMESAVPNKNYRILAGTFFFFIIAIIIFFFFTWIC